MNISNFCSHLSGLVDENEFLNTKIVFGNLYKNSVLDYDINENIFNRFKSFTESRYNMESKSIKIYHLNDTKLYSYNDSTHICIRELPIKYCDFTLNNQNKYNNFGFRLICKNQRMINNINFPSIMEYDNIDTIDIDFCNIKYKNSEIILEFHNNNGVFSIVIKSKIDKYNIGNFLQNFQFIISKLLIKKINIVSRKKSSVKNKHLHNKIY